MNKKIFVACDTINPNKVKKIIKYTQSKKLKIGYKFGLEFFYSKSGRSFLSKLSKKQVIFLDLKLNDIPNTCISAINSLKDIGIIHKGKTKSVSKVSGIKYDYIVGMGCGDECPVIPGARRLEWNIPDPKTFEEKKFNTSNKSKKSRTKGKR